ncbi:TIGR04255 family protein [Lysobacter capsici]|uniref:TIGR04255 family protein n=1 Tax=Lysobacter capsici TaxID=435897 RepID=UPI000BBB4D63|nr:TIGR04255 family protein [Lysobacter capsici]ATE73826.1 hypothetical protein CNO08_22160 [Lysobacter capsici]
MAEAKALRNPPIQEAVVQFKFLGVNLKAEELKQLSEIYEAEGWVAEEIHSFETTVRSISEGSPEVLAVKDFVGIHVISPDGIDLVYLRGAEVAASTRKYRSWEDLMEHARIAFERFVSFARPTSVCGLSARFINRIAPYPGLESFSDVLTRPPVALDDQLPGATISDFLRRHVVTGLQGEFSALLTIGTVKAEPDEDEGGKGLVIDTDVRKECEIRPEFDLLSEDLITLRSIKNKLFFGSLTEQVMERFQ